MSSNLAEIRRAVVSPTPNSGPPESARRAARISAYGRAPWELSAGEFDAIAEPFVQLLPTMRGHGFPSSRTFGLTVSAMRFGMRLRLMVFGGPEDGYIADVAWSDAASLEDPRRAFIVDALGHGQYVPAAVLADYPDLVDGFRPS
jgi:hypothetical protein